MKRGLQERDTNTTLHVFSARTDGIPKRSSLLSSVQCEQQNQSTPLRHSSESSRPSLSRIGSSPTGWRMSFTSRIISRLHIGLKLRESSHSLWTHISTLLRKLVCEVAGWLGSMLNVKQTVSENEVKRGKVKKAKERNKRETEEKETRDHTP
ncbi:hypothetical protein I7I53_08656 [Histoplasma capsulatum var. duboisii H88]|uniref:Uncharacterized protein n=1 Tax=Ajellomyces capsulatus (strain H88) TaxID=544711 RepID=A0A8A1LJS2_AJEC8|nr:hypothetical protein I7I53_08656 [Histoplasma capsulatum var. duboisii H88]